MSFSRRSILASVWTIVGLLTITSFVIAFIFAYASTKYDDNYGGGGDDAYAQQGVAAISVTSRAMVFAAVSFGSFSFCRHKYFLRASYKYDAFVTFHLRKSLRSGRPSCQQYL